MDPRPAQEALADCMSRPVGSWTLTDGALAIARLGKPELESAPVLARLDDLRTRALRAIGGARHPRFTAAGLARSLFFNQRFRRASGFPLPTESCYIDWALENRQACPVLLALIFAEVARLCGFRFQGVVIPGHFLLRADYGGTVSLFDPVRRGRPVSPAEFNKLVAAATGERNGIRNGYLRPISPQQFLARLVTHLKTLFWGRADFAGTLAAVDLMLTIRPDDPREIRDRGHLLLKLNRYEESIAALETYLSINPRGEDAEVVRLLLLEARRKR